MLLFTGLHLEYESSKRSCLHVFSQTMPFFLPPQPTTITLLLLHKLLQRHTENLDLPKPMGSFSPMRHQASTEFGLSLVFIISLLWVVVELLVFKDICTERLPLF